MSETVKKIISGKVREVYEVSGDKLAIVVTDRISAFDVILATDIQGKGIALNKIADYWFNYTKNIVKNHVISTDINEMPDFFKNDKAIYNKRTMLVKKLKMIPFEVVVRGYMFGSMYKAYKNGEPFCGEIINGDYDLAEKLATPIITPSTKATEGHDVYIPLEEFRKQLGNELADKIIDVSLKLYNACYEHAQERGIIIADTKFEFGIDADGELVIADEIFTPDSSRFWDKSAYKVGTSPSSYDKQFVRDYLIANKLDGVTPAPSLPKDIADATANIYKSCYSKITGKDEY